MYLISDFVRLVRSDYGVNHFNTINVFIFQQLFFVSFCWILGINIPLILSLLGIGFLSYSHSGYFLNYVYIFLGFI